MANPQLRTLQKVFGGVGAALFVMALLVAAHTVYFIRSAVHAQGEVIDLLHVESDDDGDGTWKPRVRFRTAAGETIDFESSTSSNPPSYEVGEAVRVLHAPGNPRNARIDSFFSLWGMPIVFGAIGTAFLVVVLVLAIAAAATPAQPTRRGRRRPR
ncbi:Protein of unknown function [Variovorax sp. PDC80]|uniref:DUF3592 domain-containing protein n=1 Tax=Variovorax sp. PDC80 TaxID=1882827 RepID=UPI0008EF82BA|nr:DUF3592 domain-containing protein [Variovorax sp. PDC80]SFO30927.1 Protein of unknown function [Variovorax sp. PDC80]